MNISKISFQRLYITEKNLYPLDFCKGRYMIRGKRIDAMTQGLGVYLQYSSIPDASITLTCIKSLAFIY